MKWNQLTEANYRGYFLLEGRNVTTEAITPNAVAWWETLRTVTKASVELCVTI